MSNETDIFPSLGGEPTQHTAPQRASLTIRLPAARKLTPFDAHQQNQFEWRVRSFLRSLPASRRAEIAARARFYRLPWIRRADEPDPDDTLF